MDRIGNRLPLAEVERCWRETFPELDFQPNTPWCDTGADSLKSTLFMLRLEEQLGFAIPLDNLSRDTTPLQLAMAIERLSRDRSRVEPNSLVATPFLIPGLLGDEPRLVTFRQAFPDEIQFTLLSLPDIDRHSSELASIPKSARIMMRDVMRMQPSGPVKIVGYSIGGVLAYELACQLEGEGREVEFLGLLDPFLRISPTKPLVEPGRTPSPVISGGNPLRSTGTSLWEKIAFGLPLLTGNLERARKNLVKVAPSLPIETLYWRRQRLIGRLRWKALRKWRPQPIDVPALLISSDEAGEHFDVTMWDRLLTRLQRVHVGGTHLGLFDPQPLAEMLPTLVDRLGQDQ